MYTYTDLLHPEISVSINMKLNVWCKSICDHKYNISQTVDRVWTSSCTVLFVKGLGRLALTSSPGSPLSLGTETNLAGKKKALNGNDGHQLQIAKIAHHFYINEGEKLAVTQMQQCSHPALVCLIPSCIHVPTASSLTPP